MKPGNDPVRLVAQLRSLIAKGHTLTVAAARIGRSTTTTFEIAKRHRLAMRRRALPIAKRRKLERHIQAARLTLSEIARKLQVAKSTVSRHSSKLLEQECGPKLTKRLKKAIRCPEGHKIYEVPCQTCRALANSAKPRAD